MRIEQHVIKAFEDVGRHEFDAGLLHACIALDGTTQKYAGKELAAAQDFKKLIRDYCWIIEPMIGAGLNLEDTKWRGLTILNSRGQPILDPDFADIIYHIIRCPHAHGKEIPAGYGFLPVEDGKSEWRIADNSLYMPTRAIWALLAVSVFTKVNADIETSTDHYLTWGSESLGIQKFSLRHSWGKEHELREFFSKQNLIRVKLDFSDH
jgi:hypothetical protein